MCPIVLSGNNSSHSFRPLRRSRCQAVYRPHADPTCNQTLGVAPPVSAICDSGSTHTLLRASHATYLSDVAPYHDLCVSLPYGATIKSTHNGTLAVGNLPAYVFSNSDLWQSLLSLSTLCNQHNCYITLTLSDISLHQDYVPLFHGVKQPHVSLWHMDLDDLLAKLPLQSSPLANKTDTNAKFAAFIHASFGSPSLYTLQHAVRMGGYLLTAPWSPPTHCIL